MSSRSSRPFLTVLCNLRWLAIACQAFTVLTVTAFLHVSLPQAPLWIGIGALTSFNLYATWRIRSGSARSARST